MALPEVVSREEWLYRDLSGKLDDDEAEDVPGAEQTISAYALLDMTAFRRSEDWEEPKERARAQHAADPTFTD